MRLGNDLMLLLLGFLIGQAIAAPSELTTIQGNNEVNQVELDSSKTARPNTDIVINSLDEGPLTNNQGLSERHLYDRQEDLNKTKPDPRNQQEDQQQQASSVSAQEPLILDHRPTGGEQNNEFVPTTTTQSPLSSAATSYNSIVVNSTNQQYQPNSWYPQIGSAGQSTVQQQQSVHHATGYHQQQTSSLAPQAAQSGAQLAGQTQMANYGNAMAASNQVVSVQHPNSINTMSDHQQSLQQQPQASTISQMAVPASPASSPSAQQGQLVSMNGQPVFLMNQNSPNGGRRISISGWLKGLSSMLANIFNRRDHGTMLSGQASNPMGHWVQLSSNAPHWLTQAQTLIQQQQQQFQQQFNPQPLLNTASSNRYATYVPAPQAMQLQPASVQTGNSILTQQHPLTTVNSNNNYQPGQSAGSNGGDMQVSGSSTSYIAVQAPSQMSQAVVQYPSALPVQQTSAPVRQAASGEQSRNQNPVNHHQQQQQQHTAGPSQQSQVRYNRSSSSSTSASSQNLPLAHYSRYGVAVD